MISPNYGTPKVFNPCYPLHRAVPSYANPSQVTRTHSCFHRSDRGFRLTSTSFDAYRVALSQYARRLLNPKLAQRIDLSGVVQQTLVDALAAPPLTDQPVWGWLRTLLRRNYIDAARRERAARRDGRRDRPLSGADDVAFGETPSRCVQLAEETASLLTALETLPPDQLESVRLRYLDGLGVDEIAATTGKSRAAVAGLLRRGLAALRERLDPRPQAQ